MAEKNFKVNEPIKIEYQAPNKQSGLTIIAEILLPGDIEDTNYPDLSLTEVLGKGIYTGEFIPDQTGEWAAIVHDGAGDGQVVKRYSVGDYDVHTVGNEMAKNSTVAKESTLLQTETDIRGTDLDTLKTLSDQLDDVGNAVGGLDTPPIIS